MIFGSTMLEVAIGIIFVYLLVSLLCSALNELIEAFLQYRATNLQKGIEKLLGDKGLAGDLLNHPLVKPLGERPSYIPSRTFSLALWNMATTRAAAAAKAKAEEAAKAGTVATPPPPPPKEGGPTPPPPTRTVADDVKSAAGAAAGVTQNLREIRALIEGVDDARFNSIKVSLLSLMDEAGNDITKARENIENWYDDAMDRVSGWYKRRTHKILVVIGLAAAALLNIDTINITKALIYNDTLRASVVKAAEEYIDENQSSPDNGATTNTNTNTNAGTGTNTNTRGASTNTNTNANTNANANANANANTGATSPNGTPVAAASPVATATPAVSPTASPVASPSPSPSPSPESPEARARRAREQITKVRGDLESLGLPIGWVSEPEAPQEKDFMDGATNKLDRKRFDEAKARYDRESLDYPSDPRRVPDHLYGWLLKVIGIFITGLAVSQGAPFWFDLLNKFIVIRSTVKPREKSQDQPSKDTTTKPKKPKDEDDENEQGNRGGGS